MTIGGSFRKGENFMSEMTLGFDSIVLLSCCAICRPTLPILLFFSFFFFNWSIVRASFIAQLVKNSPAMQETPVRFVGQEDPLEKERLPNPVSWPGEFHELYTVIVQGIAKSQTWLNDFHSLSHSWLTKCCVCFWCTARWFTIYI